jgi:predicted TIM-barrel fold metal-dependent hydrolase
MGGGNVVIRQGFSASRRELLELSLFGAIASLIPAKAFAQATGDAQFRIGDAHVHLFNLADLPARGFIRHAFVPPAKADRGIFPAALDLIDRLRAIPISASEELRDHAAGKPCATVPASRIFNEANRIIDREARRSAIRTRGLIGLAKLFDKPLDLADSYGFLAAIREYLSRKARKHGSSLEKILGVAPPGGEDVLFGGTSHKFRSGLVDWLLRNLVTPEDPQCREAPSSQSEASLNAIREQLLWIHLMVQPRRFILDRYVQTILGKASRPATIINLLVDYDRWVADRPGEGSSHAEQIAFWTAMIPDCQARGVKLRTFAGFDPLRHAEERLDCKERYLKEMLGYFAQRDEAGASHKIHGFKLYPPMGFAPSGNRPFLFESHDASMEPIRARWAARFPDHQLHRELDNALDHFFGICAADGIPVLAHARHSNEAGLCFGARASPLGWEDVVTKHRKLRLCLGHFAETKDFLAGMKRLADNKLPHPRSWAVTATSRLLEMNQSENPTNVYADISYMSELLLKREGKGRARARAFFLQLKEYCRRFDPQCRHLVFGSDWIMLAREYRNQEYVGIIRQGMDDALWSDEWQENLLYANLERFLGPASA